ncbi:hypothetical protein HYPBUDRAFT_192037 [Hyphopichia burtonii NRRL Y-1933]|uniref:Zn(2)-C6 fungal-type domain-containing protein n=1 Tax=Hyphopichia burtonii NRRL Y-1933 TaxID=984485 RepID=A0A1E4RNJ2_9ASCO|nr:hypothetical protein HYPBUDRAFT_192037 [Hyphopichia burtonii NRRL Y-1933]ODV68842.1 hypothetical protein HYPBUDRAFT_192037 [Hyphopichia burtonii NRRL Y-1933]
MKYSKKQLSNQVNSLRPYKSRSQRPCDFCRKRKTCCIIDKLIPCISCIQFNQGNCTFKNGPVKRIVRKKDVKNVKEELKFPTILSEEKIKEVPASFDNSTSQSSSQSTSSQSSIYSDNSDSFDEKLLSFDLFPHHLINQDIFNTNIYDYYYNLNF